MDRLGAKIHSTWRIRSVPPKVPTEAAAEFKLKSLQAALFTFMLTFKNDAHKPNVIGFEICNFAF